MERMYGIRINNTNSFATIGETKWTTYTLHYENFDFLREEEGNLVVAYCINFFLTNQRLDVLWNKSNNEFTVRLYGHQYLTNKQTEIVLNTAKLSPCLSVYQFFICTYFKIITARSGLERKYFTDRKHEIYTLSFQIHFVII